MGLQQPKIPPPQCNDETIASMLVPIWIHVHWLCAAVFVAAARGALSGLTQRFCNLCQTSNIPSPFHDTPTSPQKLRVVVAEVNVQAETAVPALHVLGAGRQEWMNCTIMSFGMLSPCPRVGNHRRRCSF